jgi:hypothetical protein
MADRREFGMMTAGTLHSRIESGEKGIEIQAHPFSTRDPAKGKMMLFFAFDACVSVFSLRVLDQKSIFSLDVDFSEIVVLAGHVEHYKEIGPGKIPGPATSWTFWRESFRCAETLEMRIKCGVALRSCTCLVGP